MEAKRVRDPYLRALVEGTRQVMVARRCGLCTDAQVEERLARLSRRYFAGQRRMGKCV